MLTRSLGRISQIAFATRDMEASLDHFSRNLGVGPWFVLPHGKLSARYRGAACDAELIVAFANCNGLEFEMMHQTNAAPSIWKDFLAGRAERERFHHSCQRTADYPAMLPVLAAADYEMVFEGETPRGRFSYFDHPDHPGAYLELLEHTPSRQAMYAHVLAAAQDWDGQDPVRPMPPV